MVATVQRTRSQRTCQSPCRRRRHTRPRRSGLTVGRQQDELLIRVGQRGDVGAALSSLPWSASGSRAGWRGRDGVPRWPWRCSVRGGRGAAATPHGCRCRRISSQLIDDSVMATTGYGGRHLGPLGTQPAPQLTPSPRSCSSNPIDEDDQQVGGRVVTPEWLVAAVGVHRGASVGVVIREDIPRGPSE